MNHSAKPDPRSELLDDMVRALKRLDYNIAQARGVPGGARPRLVPQCPLCIGPRTVRSGRYVCLVCGLESGR